MKDVGAPAGSLHKACRSGFVALIGRPNAGKSTLLNRVIQQELSIVSPKAQTTRQRVRGILTDESRGQMVFVDTPGIHRAHAKSMNAWMIEEAARGVEDCQLIWYLVDPSSSLVHEQRVLDFLIETAPKRSCPLFLIWNKQDLLRSSTLEGETTFQTALALKLESLQPSLVSSFSISALRGTGVMSLLKASWDILPEGPLYYPEVDQLSDHPLRFFVAEKIREQLFACLGEEVPYSCAVQIHRFQEPASSPNQKLWRIEATVFVERDSQKALVIGEGGKKIKEIGQKARLQIQPLLELAPGHQVFLGLTVKVLKNWTRDPEQLERLGYGLRKAPRS